MAEVVKVPPQLGVTQLDVEDETADWLVYAKLYGKGYSKAEARAWVSKLRKGEIDSVDDIPQKR